MKFKVKTVLIIIILLLYGYWMSDLYIFMFNNNIYFLSKLENYFSEFKLFMHGINIIILIVSFLYVTIMFINSKKLIDFLDKDIELK